MIQEVGDRDRAVGFQTWDPRGMTNCSDSPSSPMGGITASWQMSLGCTCSAMRKRCASPELIPFATGFLWDSYGFLVAASDPVHHFIEDPCFAMLVAHSKLPEVSLGYACIFRCHPRLRLLFYKFTPFYIYHKSDCSPSCKATQLTDWGT